MQSGPDVRDIYLSSWMKKCVDGIDKKYEKFWIVFCVHRETLAYLEAYTSQQSASTHEPVWSALLNNALHVSPSICLDDSDHEFVITLNTQVVRLSAQTRQKMKEWMDTVRNKLIDLKVLEPKENLYCRSPEFRPSPSPRPPPLAVPSSSSEPASSEPATPSGNSDSIYEPVFMRTNSEQGEQRPEEESRRHSAPASSTTLKEQQVLMLQREMSHPVGIRMILRGKDCTGSIALVNAFGQVWIAGWRQKTHPLLYNMLHIGDRLISIEGVQVQDASESQKILKAAQGKPSVNVVVKRIPHGRALLVKRDFDGQDLGIVQQGTTAVVEAVADLGPACRAGLTPRARTLDGLSLTNWVLTEINGRPLNLFFKANEVRDRLQSVGREISILVQPYDLVKQLKKQLKSLKNYKEYIIQ